MIWMSACFPQLIIVKCFLRCSLWVDFHLWLYSTQPDGNPGALFEVKLIVDYCMGWDKWLNIWHPRNEIHPAQEDRKVLCSTEIK